MTDDKIIIDGVNVSEYTLQEIEYKLSCTIKSTIIEDFLELYKQFIRKKKKFDEQIITASMRYSELNTAWNNRCKKYDDDLKQLARCQKALEEIEKFFEHRCNLCREEYDLLPCDNCINKQILGIINKTKERKQ